MTTRVRLRIAYRGTTYHGWQRQPGTRTVEGSILSALSRILDTPEEDVVLQGASRTDAGVHALGQTAHLDHDTDRGVWDFVRGINGLTDDDITVLRAEEVSSDFHARFSTAGKIYRYRIWNHRFTHPLLLHDAWHVRADLDFELMQRAADALVGEHDFAAFRAASCQSPTTVREINRVEVIPDNGHITIWVEGTAFLKYMVRIICGTLVDVARGYRPADTIEQMIATGERGLGGKTAPPQGLTLMSVKYPEFAWEGGPPVIGGPYMVHEH